MKATAITISVLTWRAPQTLESCLNSLDPIKDYFDNKIAICQEGDQREIAIARQNGFEPIITAKNLGIQGGIKTAFALSDREIVLFLENDSILSASAEQALKAIEAAANEIEQGNVEFAQLSLEEPLENWRESPASRFWSIHDRKATRTILGRLRYRQADLLSSELTRQREMIAPDHFLFLESGFVKTSSRYRKWSNRPLLARKSFVLERLMPFAEANPTRRLVNGHPELEHRINSTKNRRRWQEMAIPLLIARPGLFTHSRLDRCDNDEKETKRVQPSHQVQNAKPLTSN